MRVKTQKNDRTDQMWRCGEIVTALMGTTLMISKPAAPQIFTGCFFYPLNKTDE